MRRLVTRPRAALVVLVMALAALLTLLATGAPLGAQGSGHAGHKNMRLLGFHHLQARSAYQPWIHQDPNTGRWIAYIGHHDGSSLNRLTGEEEPNGTSILDVTNPRRPRLLHHIPGPAPEGGAQMVRLCNCSDLPQGNASKVYLLRTLGDEAHEIWDVTDPASPELLTTVVDGLNGTHKSWWECDTGIAYLVSGAPGWRTERMTQVFDLSDPANPVHIRDYGLVGQEPGSSGPVPTELHGPISLGNRIYFGHGTSSDGIIQIVDRDKLLTGAPEPTPANLLFPQVSRLDLSSLGGAHTTFPVLDIPVTDHADFTEGATRDVIVTVNESTSDECDEAPQVMYITDITDETTPQVISNFQVPESKGNFCQRGGRFGAHSSNENMTPIYYRKLVFIAYFNAGVRAVDIRDPFDPKEVGFFIPRRTRNTEPSCVEVNGEERCKTAIQTNNVEVDNRGFIYIVDRANTGLHILKLTGAAAAIANQ
jgi:hypothetical protein